MLICFSNKLSEALETQAMRYSQAKDKSVSHKQILLHNFYAWQPRDISSSESNSKDFWEQDSTDIVFTCG